MVLPKSNGSQKTASNSNKLTLEVRLHGLAKRPCKNMVISVG